MILAIVLIVPASLILTLPVRSTVGGLSLAATVAIGVTCLCPGATKTRFDEVAGSSRSRLFTGPGVMSSPDVARAGVEGLLRGATLHPRLPARTPRISIAHSSTATAGYRRVRYSPSAIRTLTVRVIAKVPIQQGSAWVNKCAGAVEVTYPGVTPQIVQHDYCGGLWVLGLRKGERVHFVGALHGTYAVNGRRRLVRYGDPVTLAHGLGDLIAQTCIPGRNRTMQWVGLTRIAA